MESPPGPVLTNIFVLYYKENSFSETRKPRIYFRYVDDTFAIFDHEAEADEFLATLNCLHSSLKFTLKKRKTNAYLFLMSVERTDIGFEISVDRKSTFTGQNLRRESFSSVLCKLWYAYRCRYASR